MSRREREEETGFSGPDEVTQLLDELNEVDPPADLAESVMARISSMAPQRARRVEPLVQFKGGKVMAKKVLWSVMGAAAAVLIVLKIAGYPPPSEGTEGTIGAAQRYQSPQIADADVKLTDAQLQAFMQSDAFHALISDKAARQALANKEFQKALANDAIRQALASDVVRQALANDAVRQALANDLMRQALASDAVRQALTSDALKQALASDVLRQALASDVLRQAVSAPGFAASLDVAATGVVAN